jgi:hypothetical protein
MPSAAMKEEIRQRIGGRLRWKLKGVSILRGEVVLDGEGAAVCRWLVVGDAVSERRDALIELLGKLKITARHGRKTGVLQPVEDRGQRDGDVRHSLINTYRMIAVEVVEGPVVVNADLAK